MPIGADRFERLDDRDDGPSPRTNADEILSFLEAHADQAFTQSEVVGATDVPRGSVGPTLVRLREAGQVDHRGTYWRVSDHVLSSDAALGHAAGAAEGREESSLAYDEWLEHAVDPRDDHG